MTEDTKLKLIVAGTAVLVTAGASALVGTIRHTTKKRRASTDIPRPIKTERMFIIK